jgi:hypothetical protein
MDISVAAISPLNVNIDNNDSVVPFRVVSFDVGIKNLAYCVVDISSGNINIVDWRVLDLCSLDSNISLKTNTCICTVNRPLSKGKSVSSPEYITCAKIAKYKKGTEFFCTMHATRSAIWNLPNPSHSKRALKALSALEIQTLCNNAGIKLDSGVKSTRSNLVEAALQFFAVNTLEPLIIPATSPCAKNIDLITIGRRIKTVFDDIPILSTASLILIENQIGPLANRMKVIQGLITQYFIMISDNIDIRYVSSANKLRGFPPRVDNVEQMSSSSSSKKYTQHKTDAIYHTARILAENTAISHWSRVLECKKKDDFADCFLQAIWYLNSKEKVTV